MDGPLSGPPQPFWAPLVAILDFAGGAINIFNKFSIISLFTENFVKLMLE